MTSSAAWCGCCPTTPIRSTRWGTSPHTAGRLSTAQALARRADRGRPRTAGTPSIRCWRPGASRPGGCCSGSSSPRWSCSPDPKALYRILSYILTRALRHAMRWYTQMGRRVWPYEIINFLRDPPAEATGPTRCRVLGRAPQTPKKNRCPRDRGGGPGLKMPPEKTFELRAGIRGPGTAFAVLF